MRFIKSSITRVECMECIHNEDDAHPCDRCSYYLWDSMDTQCLRETVRVPKPGELWWITAISSPHAIPIAVLILYQRNTDIGSLFSFVKSDGMYILNVPMERYIMHMADEKLSPTFDRIEK